MALYATAYSKTGGNKIREIAWYIDDKRVADQEWFQQDFGPERVQLMVQADGDELSYIVQQYMSSNGDVSIPIPSGKRVVRWYGETAAMILHNL